MTVRLMSAVLIAGWLVMVLPIVGHAQQSELIDYTIGQREDSLAVWLDLAGYLSTKRLELMDEGLEFLLEYQITLSTPKRLFGSTDIAESGSLVRFGYEIVTETFYLLPSSGDSPDQTRFSSLAGLHRHLADSTAVSLCPIESLDKELSYQLEIRVNCVSHATLVPGLGQSIGSGNSPISFLFRKFLQCTGFGQESQTVQSEHFKLSEITDHR